MRMPSVSFGVLLCFGLLAGSPAAVADGEGVPQCQDGYAQAIANAKAKGLTDTLDALRSFRPIQVMWRHFDGEAVPWCRILLLDNLAILGEDTNIYAEGVELSFVTDGDKSGTGYIDTGAADLLRHRYELSTGAQPRTGPKGTRGSPNRYSVAFYDLDAGLLADLKDQNAHPAKWLFVHLFNYGWPVLLALCTWLTILIARKSGVDRRISIKQDFREALADGSYHAGSIGGVEWLLVDGEFYRTFSLTSPDQRQRHNRQVALSFILSTLEIILPLWIPARLFLNFMSPSDTISSMAAHVIERSGEFGSVLIATLAVICLRFVFMSGYQGIWGAGVLDPVALTDLEKVRRDKIHGDAKVAREDEALALINPGIEPATIQSPSAVYIGRYLDLKTKRIGIDLFYAGQRHLLLFGPNESGKSTSLIIPNLLRMRDRSIVVIDPKGELATTTATYRRTVGEVVILDPFKVLGKESEGFSPLAYLDPDSDRLLDQSAKLAEALIRIEDKDPHWSESAQSLIVALIMWEVKLARREDRVPLLENVRRMLTEPDETKLDASGKKELVSGFRITAARMCAEGGFEIASLAGRFTRNTEEIGSILSTADRQTRWLLSPALRKNLARSDIDFAELKKRPITVYVIPPVDDIQTYGAWLRLIVISALRSLFTPGGIRTIFMLDEFAQLGRLDSIESNLAVMRGFGVQLWPVLQDLPQLQALYKDRWQSFIANSGVVQGFRPNDLATAEWMSHRAGETTVVARGFNEGENENPQGRSTSDGMSHQQSKRRSFLPQELMDFRERTGVLWPISGSETIPFSAPIYDNIPELRGRAADNPYR